MENNKILQSTTAATSTTATIPMVMTRTSQRLAAKKKDGSNGPGGGGSSNTTTMNTKGSKLIGVDQVIAFQQEQNYVGSPATGTATTITATPSSSSFSSSSSSSSSDESYSIDPKTKKTKTKQTKKTKKIKKTKEKTPKAAKTVLVTKKAKKTNAAIGRLCPEMEFDPMKDAFFANLGGLGHKFQRNGDSKYRIVIRENVEEYMTFGSRNGREKRAFVEQKIIPQFRNFYIFETKEEGGSSSILSGLDKDSKWDVVMKVKRQWRPEIPKERKEIGKKIMQAFRSCKKPILLEEQMARLKKNDDATTRGEPSESLGSSSFPSTTKATKKEMDHEDHGGHHKKDGADAAYAASASPSAADAGAGTFEKEPEEGAVLETEIAPLREVTELVKWNAENCNTGDGSSDNNSSSSSFGGSDEDDGNDDSVVDTSSSTGTTEGEDSEDASQGSSSSSSSSSASKGTTGTPTKKSIVANRGSDDAGGENVSSASEMDGKKGGEGSKGNVSKKSSPGKKRRALEEEEDDDDDDDVNHKTPKQAPTNKKQKVEDSMEEEEEPAPPPTEFPSRSTTSVLLSSISGNFAFHRPEEYWETKQEFCGGATNFWTPNSLLANAEHAAAAAAASVVLPGQQQMMAPTASLVTARADASCVPFGQEQQMPPAMNATTTMPPAMSNNSTNNLAYSSENPNRNPTVTLAANINQNDPDHLAAVNLVRMASVGTPYSATAPPPMAGPSAAMAPFRQDARFNDQGGHPGMPFQSLGATATTTTTNHGSFAAPAAAALRVSAGGPTNLTGLQQLSVLKTVVLPEDQSPTPAPFEQPQRRAVAAALAAAQQQQRSMAEATMKTIQSRSLVYGGVAPSLPVAALSNNAYRLQVPTRPVQLGGVASAAWPTIPMATTTTPMGVALNGPQQWQAYDPRNAPPPPPQQVATPRQVTMPSQDDVRPRGESCDRVIRELCADMLEQQKQNTTGNKGDTEKPSQGIPKVFDRETKEKLYKHPKFQESLKPLLKVLKDVLASGTVSKPEVLDLSIYDDDDDKDQDVIHQGTAAAGGYLSGHKIPGTN